MNLHYQYPHFLEPPVVKCILHMEVYLPIAMTNRMLRSVSKEKENFINIIVVS